MRPSHALVFFFCCLFSAATVMAQQSPFEHFTSADGLVGNHIYDVLQGPDGNIWLGTDVGVQRLTGLDFEFFEVAPNQPVLGMHLDANGKLWCWTGASGVYYFEDGFQPLSQNSMLKEMVGAGNINSMAVSNNVYVGTIRPGQLLQVGPEEEVSAILLEPDNTSHYIRQLEGGAFVWGANRVSEPNKQLQVFRAVGSTAVSLSTVGENQPSQLIELGDGSLLFARGFELLHLDETGVISRLFLEQPIADLLVDSRGQLWIALENGGARCFVSGSIQSESVISYLGQQSVTSIAEDLAGNLWFGTIGEGLHFLQSGPAISYTPPAQFTKTGTEEIEEVRQSAVVGERETSPEQGEPRFIVIDTLRYDTVPPHIYITGLRIVDQEVPLQPEYALAYDENFLLINYGGVALSNPEMLQYSYKLEGLDNRWRFTNQTSVQYTTLPPGSYRFRVRTMNKEGYWSQQDAVINFDIAHPFWQTWWFIMLMSLLLFFTVGMVLLLSVKRVKRKEQYKVAINKKIAEVELQALRAQMNPHFFFNTLSSIQHYITTNDNDHALKYLSKFAKLMRRIMDNSRKGVISIKEEMAALELYLELESLRFKNKFDFRFEIDRSVDQNYDQIPAMLIQPYVENAILHGIMYKEGKGTITISLSRENEIICAVIEDDGVGRERAKEIKSSKNSTHQSSGMDITRERLEILNAANNSKLSVNIIDLKDAQGNATGTRVEIFVPASDN